MLLVHSEALLMSTHNIYFRGEIRNIHSSYLKLQLESNISFTKKNKKTHSEKLAYINKLKISPPKTESFQIKILKLIIILLKT